MGKRQAYQIHGETFPTQAALQARIRGILWSYGVESPVNERDQVFLEALIQRHPRAAQKIGGGIARMVVRQNPVYPQQRGFWIVRTDGTETDVSYLECLRHSSPRQKILSAARGVVRNDIAAFKHAAFAQAGPLFPVVCPLTATRLTPDTAHVDHIPPTTFEALVDAFMQHEGLLFTSDLVQPHHSDGQVMDIFDSAVLATAWRQFHQAHARLRLVSVQGNLRQPRRQ